MGRKLKCTIVDDDPEAHEIIIKSLKDSAIAEITHSFYKPSEFLEKMHTIAMDVIFLDIIFLNDTIQGFDLATILKKEKKVIIFISGNDEFIIEACHFAGAIDVIPKPNTRERLLDALAKAWKIIDSPVSNEKEHVLVYIAEREEKISLFLPDIYFVKTADMGDPRNKQVILKDGKEITLMDYSFNYLLKLSSRLARINISELVSYDIVDGVYHDMIHIKPNLPQEIPQMLILSKTYRKRFKDNFI